MTFITACVPTNWANGVIMIGKASSDRTRAIFEQQLVVTVRETRRRELRAEVRQHPAGDLVHVVQAVVLDRDSERLAFSLGDLGQMRR